MSAYYLGFQNTQYFLRTPLQRIILRIRSAATLILTLLPVVQTITLYNINKNNVTRLGEAELLSGLVSCISWLLHLMYTYLLYHRLSLSIRGPRSMILTWTLCLLVNIVQIRSTIMDHVHLNTTTDKVYFGCALINIICQVCCIQISFCG